MLFESPICIARCGPKAAKLPNARLCRREGRAADDIIGVIAATASPQGKLIQQVSFTATGTNNGPSATTATQFKFTDPRGYVNPRALGCAVNTNTRRVVL